MKSVNYLEGIATPQDRFGVGSLNQADEEPMKHNINVIKSVWRRLRKPSRATLDAIFSQTYCFGPSVHFTCVLAPN
jgi:hypothetical protein